MKLYKQIVFGPISYKGDGYDYDKLFGINQLELNENFISEKIKCSVTLYVLLENIENIASEIYGRNLIVEKKDSFYNNKLTKFLVINDKHNFIVRYEISHIMYFRLNLVYYNIIMNNGNQYNVI